MPIRLSSDSWDVAKDSKVLRFALPAKCDPAGRRTLDSPAPSGVKVKATTDTEGLVSKSYSPISHPDAIGHYDLLVKSYAHPAGGRHIVACFGWQISRYALLFFYVRPESIFV